MDENLLEKAQKVIKYWWLSILIGVLAIIIGVCCLFQPIEALLALTILFVAGFFVTGIIEIAFAISNRNQINGWGWTFANGIINLVLGFLLLSMPLSTPEILIYFIGFWIMFQAVWGIGVAIDLQKSGVSSWGWLLALAILGLIIAFAFVVNPGFGGSVVVTLVAIAFIFYGVFRIGLGLQLKSLK